MIKKLMRNTATAAGFAALLLVGACASTNDDLTEQNDVVEHRPEAAGMDSTVAPAAGPVKVDSDGNIYSSSAAPGKGNPSSVGTNTNVNIVPDRNRVDVRTTETAVVDTSLTSSTVTTDTTADLDTTTTVDTRVVEDSTITTAPVVTSPSVSTTVRTETTTVPMTSSSTMQETQTTPATTTTTTTRRRMSKD